MKRLEEFRIYYNHTIHPELMRMERLRLRLIGLFAFSAVLFFGVFILHFILKILPLTLLLMVMLGFFMAWLVIRIQKFRRTFKPNVISLVLDFIDDGLNLGTMYYDAKRKIERGKFLGSGIFFTPANIYEGEDYITGKVGQMEFELCELDVKEISQVRNAVETVFQGFFLHAVFPENLEGIIVAWPRHQRQYFTRAMKNFTGLGGKNVDHEILNKGFKEAYITYASADTHVVGIMPETMQEAIMEFKAKAKADVYLSFINKDLYLGMWEEKDMLEPTIFKSNLSFELIKEFFDTILMLLKVVEDFDRTH